MINKGTTIVLTVAEAAEGVQVPDAAGKSQTEATSLLEKEGFVVNVVESYDPQVEKGIVISQSPEAGTTASAGSSITIRVSQGAEDNKVRVPDVMGMEEMDATVSLTESGLTVGNVTQTTHEDASLTGKVCYQSYSVGSYTGGCFESNVILKQKERKALLHGCGEGAFIIIGNEYDRHTI